MIPRSVSSLSPVKPLGSGSGTGALNAGSHWGQTGFRDCITKRSERTHTNLHHYLLLRLCRPPFFPEGMIDSHTLNTDTLTATAQPLWYEG